MELSLPAFFSSSIAITILTMAVLIITRNIKLLSKCGIFTSYFCVILIIFRGILPFDFYTIKLTKSYYSFTILPKMQEFLQHELISAPVYTLTVESLFLGIWGIGIVFFVTKRILNYIFFYKYLKQLPILSTNSSYYDVFKSLYKEMFPRKCVCDLVYSDRISSPVVFSGRKPIIVLPKKDYNMAEFQFIIRHELSHLKHKDFYVKLLCDFICAIHWWNPVVSKYLLPITIQLQELITDFSVTKKATPNQTVIYLNCLKNTLLYTQAQKQKSSYSFIGLHTKKSIYQRVYFLTHRYKMFSPLSMVIASMLFIISFTFVFEPASNPDVTEEGYPAFWCMPPNSSYYIRNGDLYDLYLGNKFVDTFDFIYNEFKDLPIYDSKDDIP